MRIVAGLLLCLSVLSCRGGTPSADPHVRIGFGIGPSVRASGVSVITQILYAESLLVYDWTGRPVSQLAESWEWSDQGTALRLNLKKGVYFHDGTPLSPELVVRFLTKQVETQRMGFRNVTGISPAGESSISITLSRPDFFLLPELTDIKLTHPDNADVGTGPFRIVAREPAVETNRFDGYHDGRATVAGVRIQTYDTQRSAWAALMRGEVDVVQEVSRDSIEFLERSSNVKTYPSQQAFYLSLVFNVRHKALGNVEVRRAIAEAVDKRAVIDRAMRGKGSVADSPLWPHHWAYPAAAPQHRFDPVAAATRLDQAGYRLPSDGRLKEQRKRFSFKCLVYNEDPLYERLALLVQRQLFDVGISMDLELVDMETLVERTRSGDYDALLIQMHAGRTMDFTYRFWRSGIQENLYVNSGYSGADPLLDELRRSFTDHDTKRTVAALVDRFFQDVPAVFLAWTEVTRAVTSSFDVGVDGRRDPLFNISRWRVRDELVRR